MTDIVVPPPTMPQFNAVQGLQANSAALVHALCGAQYGDLEFDVGKSIRWTQWFVDDVHITDVNLGTPRYWIVNWAETYPFAFHAVTGVNFFYSTVAFRKEQWRLARLEQGIQYDAEDWVLFIDAHEGLAIDTRDPQPPNADVEPFKAYLYREIARAEAGGKDRVVLPFYAFVRHDQITNVYYPSPAFADGTLGFTTASGAMGTPYYIAAQGLTRLVKVKVLDSGSFNWAEIDTPSAPASGLNAAIVSYGYAHWNVQDIVPPATTVEPLSEANDTGWQMRKLLSMVRPIAGLPYADPYKTPAQDAAGLPGPWAATDQFTPDPVVDSGPYLYSATGAGPYASTPNAVDLGIDGDVRYTSKVRLTKGTISAPTFVQHGINSLAFAVEYRCDQLNNNAWRMSEWANGTQVTRNMVTNPELDTTYLPDGKDALIGFTVTRPADRTRFAAIKSSDGTTWAEAGTPYVYPNQIVMAAPINPLYIGQYWRGRLYWSQMEAINRAQLVFNAANSYITTPNTTPLNISGDFEIVARFSQADWEVPPGSPTTSILCLNFGNFQVTVRVYYSARGMMLQWTGTGIGTAAQNGDLQWSYPTGFPAGQPVWMRFRFDGDNGAGGHTMSFDYSTVQSITEPTSWTTGPVTTKVGTVAIQALPGNTKAISGSGNNHLNGRLARFVLRNGIGAVTPQLVFPGAAGNYLSIPTAASHIPTGDAEFVARVSMPDWTAPAGVVLAKNGSYYFMVGANSVQLWSPGTFPISSALGFAAGATGWVKATRVAATGLTSFYSAPDSPTEPTSWTARGTSTGPTGAYPNPGSVLSLGSYNINGNPFRGRILRAVIRDGIAGTAIVDVNETNAPTSAIGVAGATFPATAGGTVTVNQRQQPTFLFNNAVGNYLSTPAGGITTAGNQLEVVARVSHPDWDGASAFEGILWRQGSFILRKTSSVRAIQFTVYYGAGTAVNVNVTHAAGLFLPNVPIWLKATINMDNGAGAWVGTLSYSLAQTLVEPTTWTALTGTLTGTPQQTMTHANTTPVWIGAEDPTRGSRFRVNRIIVRNAIGGTVILDVNQENATVGAASFAATVGGTITANQTGGWIICQADPAYSFPVIQGPVLDVSENNAGQMTDSTHFLAATGQSMGLTNAAIRQAVPDRVIWRFDPKDYSGTGTVFTDPRGRQWTLTAAGAIVANTVDFLSQPVTPDPSLAGLLVPLYDTVLRINYRDGVYYEGGELGNIPLAWDDATKTWYPRNMSPQEWHDTEEWVAPVP
jgi:hypothetical protein